MIPGFKRIGVAGLALLAGCASLPSGPSVMSLPGSRKSFDEFRVDDADCRQFATVQVGGATPQKAATESGVAAAVAGTAIGAGAGALIAGSSGAGVGAGIGLVTGALVGQSYAGGSYWSVQSRYDNAYQQCMYAKGNKIQVPAAFARDLRQQSAAAAPPGPVAPFPPPPPNAPPPPR